MRNIGYYLLGFSVLSMLLKIVGMNLKILIWIDIWGNSTGWMIRGGAALLGLVIILLTKPEPEAASE
jgi:hypothetical protein